DRLHEKDGEIFVCDYKTGKRKDYKDKKNLSALESLFVADTNRNYHAFQAFLYSMLQKRTYEKVFPAMIHPIAMITSDYEMEFRKDDRLEYDDLKVEDSSGQTKSFEDFLREKLDELFDKNNSFRKYEKTDCRYCEFKQLCQDGIGIKD
ncbi:MAG: PD-(D/E)XK nuclease family protein, partial [Paludibacteraceae bacterium]|nr:PD-(D/E)XK nuclease family protein [Paludibacteraceae bacterium]